MASAVLPGWTGRFTRQRRLVQAAFLALFVLLPVFDLLRFDLPAGKLFLFGQEIWLDEWALLWLALMFAMWLVGAVSLVFGRVYCAYACPQTVFSELAHDADAIAKRLVRRLVPSRRAPAARGISLALVALLSLASTALFMAYFAPLPDVLRRIAHLDFGPWVGAVGAITTLLAFLNLAFVRETFCHSACPYGLLQGVIEDGRSLHVRLDESTGECIDCKACARVCPMGIDIRDGSFQIECTRCGSCIDSCDAVLGRLKPARPGVLRFDFLGFAQGRLGPQALARDRGHGRVRGRPGGGGRDSPALHRAALAGLRRGRRDVHGRPVARGGPVPAAGLEPDPGSRRSSRAPRGPARDGAGRGPRGPDRARRRRAQVRGDREGAERRALGERHALLLGRDHERRREAGGRDVLRPREEVVITPKASFGRHEGRLLQALLWATGAVFIALMILTWVAAERANPVMLDLETGKPVAEKPAL